VHTTFVIGDNRVAWQHVRSDWLAK